jgi:hypothetical protein
VTVPAEEMAQVTENHPPESTPPEAEQPVSTAEQPVSTEEQPPASPPAEDPGYLTETGEAAGDDGSVAPIIGGLPAVEGSAWDIGAPADERGAALVHDQADQEREAGQEDER